MKKILFIIMLTMLLAFSFCELLFAQSGRCIILIYPNRTIYEREFGEGEYTPLSVEWVKRYGLRANNGGILTNTYKETCWVGTPGYRQGKKNPEIIRYQRLSADSSAYYGLQKHILKELEKRGELEMTRPNGNVVNVPKSSKGKAFNEAKTKYILDQILADPYGTQVEGVFELKEKGK